jgi:prophage antirepressor-like protein
MASSNSLTVFNFDSAQVRVVTCDGEPMFVAVDVCRVLGYADPSKAVKQHCKGAAKRLPLATAGGTQEARVLGEPDVLRLIVRSTLPGAVAFERWVFEEVLPAIRKTGSYSTFKIPTTFHEALRLAADEHEARVEAETKLIEAAPKLAFVDDFCEPSAAALGFRDLCKKFNVREPVFKQWLLDEGIVFLQNEREGRVMRPTKDYVAFGYIEMRTEKQPSGFCVERLYYTGAGQLWLHGKWKKHLCPR